MSERYSGKSKQRVQMEQCQKDKIINICVGFRNDPGELISILHKVQGAMGYLPEDVQRTVAECLGIPVARVYGVVSFYSFFTMTPKGRHPVSVCMGTACYVRGAEKVLEELTSRLGIGVGEVTPDGRFSLDSLRCVGACGLAPVVMVGEKVYGRVQKSEIKGILENYE